MPRSAATRIEHGRYTDVDYLAFRSSRWIKVARAVAGVGAIFIYRDVSIGDNVVVGRYNIIHRCDFGNYALTGEHSVLLSGSRQHNMDRTDIPIALQRGRKKRIAIGDDGFIGAHAVVMDDVGRGAVVGAGAVVTRPVPEFTIVAGNPARPLRRRGTPAATTGNLDALESAGVPRHGGATGSGRLSRDDRVMRRCRSRLLWAMSLLLGLTAGCSAARSEAPDYARTPVLFVHGHGGSSAYWRPLIKYLIGIGYPREYLHAVDIVPDTMANDRAATSVIAPETAALRVRATTAAQSAGYRGEVPRQLDIVSGSMGAVSSRWYAAKLRPDLVRTWISLVGANHGTNALCGLADEAARAMCPAFATNAKTHALQLALNGADGAWVDETPYGLGIDRPGVPRLPPDSTRSILYLTVRIEPDRWIQPEHSALLDGAGGVPIAVPQRAPVQETSPGNFLFQARVQHDPLLEHPDLMRLVAAMLAARDRARGDGRVAFVGARLGQPITSGTQGH